MLPADENQPRTSTPVTRPQRGKRVESGEPRKPRPSDRPSLNKPQRTYYVAAEYIDHSDRLLVEEGEAIELYSLDLRLAQHWYAQAWRGERLDLSPFKAQRLDWDMDPKQAEHIKSSGLVLAQCVGHGEGVPVVEEYNGHSVYGPAVDILIGEVFHAALGHLIEQETGIAGLTISPMHTRYALHEGRHVGRAAMDAIARSVTQERPNLTPHTAPDGTVTILFSDIENSTTLNERLGDGRWMTLLCEHNAMVRRQKAIHRGFEVKTIGDAFMLAFRSARDALRCAIGIQRAFAIRNKTVKPPLHVRIGVHTGELVREADDFYGLHVNFAARIAAKANAGEILVSSLLRELVEPSGEFRFDARQATALKGFQKKHTVHVVRWTEAG